MANSKKPLIERRKFLKGAAVGGIATFIANNGAEGAQQSSATRSGPVPLAPRETDPPPTVEVLTTDRPGADFMVDVIKSLGFEYAAACPGATFRGIHESLVNHGGNTGPELITCCHEESSIGIAHGYAEVEGKPMMAMVHSTVGLQHASMGIYNAWAGRAPVYLIVGNVIDATNRGGIVAWDHAAQDVAALVRDYTKWDDLPISLPHFAESAVRAYKIAMTPPMEPVVLVVDMDLQETPIAKDVSLHIPKVALDSPVQGDPGALTELARLLVAADNPLVIAGRVARSQEGMDRFIEFVEALQVPVLDQGANLPSRHPLNQSMGGRVLIQNADVILALEIEDFWGAIHSTQDQLYSTDSLITKKDAKLISLGNKDLYIKSNLQDFGRFTEVDLAIAGDPEATLPSLIVAVNRLITDDRRRVFQDRGKKFAAASQAALQRARTQATYGWDSSPISLPRLSAEVWAQVKNEDWATTSGGSVDPGILNSSWNYEKFYQRTHGGSAFGVGFVAPSAVGAALAHKKHGRFFVYGQADGDLMFAPGVLWTAAHHQIPLLAVMHNNRAYHQEVMHVQRMCARHERGITNAGIGTKLENPNLDFAKIAQGMGWYAEGPISDPKDLGPAIRRAIDVVKRGEPALLDTVTQPR